MTDAVAAVRAFSRFYTRFAGVLDAHYMESELSLVEARLLWEIAKRGFAYYLTRIPAYDRVYGTIGSAIGLVFWIYYSSVILLLGAELASVLQNVHPHSGRDEPRHRRHEAPVAPRGIHKKSRHRRG